MKNITMLLFLFGTIPLTIFFAWVDVSYWWKGAIVEGQVISAVRRNVGRDQSIDVVYLFIDPKAGARKEEYRLGAAWDVPAGAINIEYIPGELGWSRVAGDLSPSVFLCSGVGLVSLFAVGLLIYKRFYPNSEDNLSEVER